MSLTTTQCSLESASIIALLIYRQRKGAYGPTHYTLMEGVGLYWHIVDLVCIFLFPLLYLVH